MENKKVEFVKSAKNNSILVKNDEEQLLELFTDEKNIQPIIEVFDLMINNRAIVNIDLADILDMAKNNNAYFANYIQIKGTIEDTIPQSLSKNRSKCVIIAIKSAQKVVVPSSITKFISNITDSLFVDIDASIVWGVSFDNTLNDNEIVASIIELLNRTE